MKKLPLLILCFFCCYLIQAQEVFRPSTHVGIHGGLNFSIVSFNPSVKQDMIQSNAFGIFFRHVSEPNIGLQVEANIAGKGWREVIDSIGTYTRRIETLDIPVLAAFIAGKRKLRFAFTIGPYVSYRRHETESIDIPKNPKIISLTNRSIRYKSEVITLTDKSYSRPHFLQPLVNDWEFGFSGGLSVELYTKIGGFAVRANYNHALSNLFPLNVDDYYFSGSRQQVIHGGVMYFVTF